MKSAHAAHRLKTAFCFRLLRLSFYQFESVKSHRNIIRRYVLAPLLLCCWKGEILQCNSVSLLFNMLRLVENKDLTSDSTISAGDAAVRAGIWKVVFHHQWRGPSN
jgi:hypothetical protein